MSDRPAHASLGRLLAAWEAGAQKSAEETQRAFEMLDVCGGAYLFLTREAADAMVKMGAKFDTDPYKTIPVSGRGSVRVRCGQPIDTKVISEDLPGTDGSNGQTWRRTVKYGLCSRCAGWELAIRISMRKASKEAESQAKTGYRKRGFREDAAE